MNVSKFFLQKNCRSLGSVVLGRVLKFFMLFMVGILAIFVLLELALRGYVAFNPTLGFASHMEFRQSIPPPYKDTNYNVHDFLAESFGLPGWYTPKGTRLVIPFDFRGQYINIRDGKRSTTSTGKFRNNIFIFGGSTVFNSEVPDPDTMPSLLQALVNRNGRAYNVHNFGSSTVVISQEYERLRTVSLNPGDIVIFLDGANDCYLGIYQKNSGGWIVGQNNAEAEKITRLQRILLSIHSRYSRHSYFIKLFLSPTNYYAMPQHLKNQFLVQNLATEVGVKYETYAILADDYVRSRGGHFFAFIQPTIYTLNPESDYENTLKHNPYLINKGIDIALTHGYQSLGVSIENLKNKGINATLLTDALNGYQGNYLDWAHLTRSGNMRVAEDIYKIIFSGS